MKKNTGSSLMDKLLPVFPGFSNVYGFCLNILIFM
jgi:hypothetical protein